MCRVEIATEAAVEIQPPLRPAAVEVVVVAPFGMDYLADRSLPDVTDGGDHFLVIATVFEQRAMAARLLRGIDEAPEVVHRQCGGHLNGHMFSGLHGGNGDFGVSVPIGADDHEVHIVATTQLQVAVVSAVAGNTIGVYRQSLEGRVDGDKYALILRLTNMELKSIE